MGIKLADDRSNLMRMKKIVCFLPIVIVSLAIQAQSPMVKKHRIALFAPLYLDSAFDRTGNYRYGKTEFPDFISPGLEFYEGAQLALDSMSREGKQLEVFVYDTRSASQTLAQQQPPPCRKHLQPTKRSLFNML